MESGDLRIVLELSFYKSDLQYNRMGIFKLEQEIELFWNAFIPGWFKRIPSVSRNVK